MKKINKKKHLEIIIESIPKHLNPKIDLEQYSTPATIAADLLWNAKSFGDINNKEIIDLGCGTGIFTMGSAILGAKSAIGFDIDEESIVMANKIANSMEIFNVEFFKRNIYNLNNNKSEDFRKKFNTSFTNPPFGSQLKNKKKADRIFMEWSINLAEICYSFHMAKTRDFVFSYYENLGGKITDEFYYKFPIPHSYSFHTEESKSIDIIVVRVENV